MRALLIAAVLLASGAAQAENLLPITPMETAFSQCRIFTVENKINGNLIEQFMYDCMILKGFRGKPDPAAQAMIDAQRKPTINKKSVDEFLKTLEPKTR